MLTLADFEIVFCTVPLQKFRSADEIRHMDNGTYHGLGRCWHRGVFRWTDLWTDAQLHTALCSE